MNRTPQVPSGRRRPGPPRTLDVERVVAAALDLLDAGGPGALSVRAVAGRLGVNPNAIYTYVADRRSLECAIVECVLADAGAARLAESGQPWRTQILEYGASLREALLRHPGAVPLFMTAPMNGPNALAVGERLLGAFADAGLAPDDAARATYAVIVHVLGSVALEVAETDGRPPLPDEAERVERRRAGFASVNLTDHPMTAATSDVMARWISTEQFAWTFERLLDAITRRKATD